MFSDKNIVVGVCAGIAIYKTCELVRELKRLHANVRVMMTPGATRFIAPLTFQALSGAAVSVDPFEIPQQDDIEHIELSHWADVIVIAPATANTIAKLASGMADNVVTATVLASHAPVVLAPAMNTHMWENVATVENLQRLKERFFYIVEPEYGELASKREGQGMGRMARVERIITQILYAATQPKRLAGVKITVTAGRTEEYFDPVRMLTNRASGRMGFALAEMAAAMGADVTLISGPTDLTPPDGVQYFQVVHARQMLEMVEKQYPENGVLVMAAAVSDFRPERFSENKIKKSGNRLQVNLVPNPDILATVAKRKQALHVGFALETDDELKHARDKLKRKKLDLIVVNNPNIPGAGFAVSTNKVTLLFADGKTEELPLLDKRLVALEILQRVAEMLER